MRSPPPSRNFAQKSCKKLLPPVTTLNVDSPQDAHYREAAAEYGAALERLARAYEADPDRRRDLLQEIHLALWRSFAAFNGLCSLRTWVYRVAHNAATSHVLRERRTRAQVLVTVEELEAMPDLLLPDILAPFGSIHPPTPRVPMPSTRASRPLLCLRRTQWPA